MNILYVGTLPPHNGGSAINATQILEGFVSSGHTVHAIETAHRHSMGNSVAGHLRVLEALNSPR